MSKRLLRSEVPVEHTWDLSDLYATEEAFENDLEKVTTLVNDYTKYKGRLFEETDSLLNAIEDYTVIYGHFIRIMTYSNLRQSEDGTNPENQSRSMKAGAKMAQLGSSLTFFESELLDLDEAAYAQLFVNQPKLLKYKNHLDDIYSEKKHRLSPETEQLLASMGTVLNAPYRTYSVSKSSDMIFDDVKNGNGETLPNSFVLFENNYEFSSDNTLRKNAYESFSKTLNQYKNTYAAVYATEINKQMAISKARGYESVYHFLLKDQKIEFDMYKNQIQLIYTKLAPHMRRFAKLKKEQLGLDTMHYYDLKATLDPSFVPPATYEEIQTMLIDALGILGEEYQGIIKKAFSNRWIDYANNVGKSTGAFCSSPYGIHPYVLISYEENMRLAFTLAHELGHAGHFQLAMNEQSIFDVRPSTYFVEAPSTINEMLFAEYLMKKENSPRMKRWVILQLMGTYYHNFVTHLLEAEFQRRVYEFAESGRPLTANLLCETMGDVLKTFWGDEVEIDENAGLTWMRQPHYYMGLYPYTYSAGLSAATAIAKQIFAEGEVAVNRWLDTLRAGGSKTPHELLKGAGIDMSTPAPVESAVAYVGELIDELVHLFK